MCFIDKAAVRGLELDLTRWLEEYGTESRLVGRSGKAIKVTGSSNLSMAEDTFFLFKTDS